jgi:hypothetical protein
MRSLRNKKWKRSVEEEGEMKTEMQKNKDREQICER